MPDFFTSRVTKASPAMPVESSSAVNCDVLLAKPLFFAISCVVRIASPQAGQIEPVYGTFHLLLQTGAFQGALLSNLLQM